MIPLGYQLRLADNADQAKILSLITPVLESYGFAVDFSASDADLVDIQRTYVDSGGWFCLLEDEKNNLVGTIGFCPLTERIGKLRKMYIRPDLHGRGLGKALLLDTIHRARDRGYEEILLETVLAMHQAIGLYEKMGFHRIQRAPVSPRCEVVYQLKLSSS